VDGKGDWLGELNVDWQETKKVEASDNLEGLLQQFAEVVSEELGTYSGPPVHICLKENANPKFFKARQVPSAVSRWRSGWTRRCGRCPQASASL
jgi:hypothetical protein